MERLYIHPMKGLMARHTAYDEDVKYRIARETVPKKALTHHNPKADEQLYYNAMKRKQDGLKKLEQKYAVNREYLKYIQEHNVHTKLTEEDLGALGTRLCNQSMERKKKLLEAAEKKAYGTPAEAEKLSKDRLKALGERLCNSSMSHKYENLAKLEEKYLWKPHKCAGRATPEMFERLSKK